MKTYFKIEPEMYTSQPMCNITDCLKRDYCYCMASMHNISPNSKDCKEKMTVK